MHIALVGPYAGQGSPGGGVESSVTRLARGLVQRGVQVTVLAPGRPSDERDGHLRVLRVWPRAGRLLPPDRLSYPRAFRPWRRVIAARLDELQPDIAHGHGMLSHGL